MRHRKRGSDMRFVIGIFLFVPIIAMVIATLALNWALDANCLGRLKRAADANTVQLAQTELSAAVKYAEENNLTSGYTSILYRTPDEDIGFWYKNLKESEKELAALPAESPPMERTNVLMKLRETLLDTDSQGQTVVTSPSGLVRAPYNTMWAFGWGVSILLVLAGWAIINDGD